MPPQLQEPSLPTHLRVSPEIPKSNKESKYKIPRFPGRKLLPLLVFILSSLSILRLLRISYKSSAAAASRPFSPPAFQPAKATVTDLTVKELKLLSDAVTSRSPCNILVFGFASQYLMLSSINNGGITVFLQDEPAKITTTDANNTRIYDVKYHEMEVKKTYKLLRYARANPACAPNVNLQGSSCKLQLKDLPEKVYDIKWDVIVVDGPGGDALEAPGRMGTIYTAAVLARQGSNSTTDVFVHDVHRTAEKWFSWEFLCQENLVSAKGNFWKFRIKGQSNTSRFCSPES